MSEEYPPPVVLDTTVLSNFASTDAIEVLVELLESPAVVPAVIDEMNEGRDFGYEYLTVAIETFGEGIQILDVDPADGTAKIRDRLDAGEAESLRAAIERRGTLATDDLAARQLADEQNRPVIGSIGLLVLAVTRRLIDQSTTGEWLDTWRDQRGNYAPVDSVEELLDGEHDVR